MEEYKINFDDLDVSKIKGDYLRIHYGDVSTGVKKSKVVFDFRIFEYVSPKYNKMMLIFTDHKPSFDCNTEILEKLKLKLK